MRLMRVSAKDVKAPFTQDAEHLATGVHDFETLQSLGVFTQLAHNIKGCENLRANVLLRPV